MSRTGARSARRARLQRIAGVGLGVALVGVALVTLATSSDEPHGVSAPVTTTVTPQRIETQTASTETSLQLPPTTTGPCEVTELLVPTCGAWLGASTPSRDGSYDYVVGLAEYEAAAQDPPDILHFYIRGAVLFPTPQDRALSEPDGSRRSLLHYSWKPSTSHTWRQIADGAADDNIRMVAEGLRAYPYRLFLAINHEPENDVKGSGSGMTAADYVDMYRHVVDMLRELGISNVVYVMNYMGFDTWADLVDDLYPGDEYVDWIAYDPYGFPEANHLAEIVDDPNPGEDWPGFYTWATSRHPGKPLMLAEWGFDLRGRASAADVLRDAAVIMERDFPQLKAFVYWNDHKPGGFVVRLDEGTAVGDELAAAYREFADSPYFAAVRPDQAP